MASDLATLAHVLVLVYWLGGDLGAFHASFILTDRTRPQAVRAMAGMMLAHLDMAPRSALILALPTGVSLLAVKGWWPLPAALVAAVWIGALVWLALVWWLHLRHVPPGHMLRRADLGIRWLVLAGLVTAALVLEPPGGALPLFVQIKLLILAAAIGCGLWIRVILGPFGAAFGALAAGRAEAAEDAVIHSALARARPIVLCLWALLLAAAGLGIAKPV